MLWAVKLRSGRRANAMMSGVCASVAIISEGQRAGSWRFRQCAPLSSSRQGPRSGRYLVPADSVGFVSTSLARVGKFFFTRLSATDKTDKNRFPSPGRPMAAGAAQGNRQLVADQFATAVSQDRRAVGKACAVLLALAGQESSDAAAICADAR